MHPSSIILLIMQHWSNHIHTHPSPQPPFINPVPNPTSNHTYSFIFTFILFTYFKLFTFFTLYPLKHIYLFNIHTFIHQSRISVPFISYFLHLVFHFINLFLAALYTYALSVINAFSALLLFPSCIDDFSAAKNLSKILKNEKNFILTNDALIDKQGDC